MKAARRVTLVLASVLLGLAGVAASEPPGPLEADQVLYASMAVDNNYHFALRCSAVGDSVGDVVLAYATEHADKWTPTAVIVFPRSSSTGHLIQVMDQQMVYEARVEQAPPRLLGISGFGHVITGGKPPLKAHFALGVWDGALSCTLSVDDVSATIQEFPGSHAIYVGPEAFGGGAFYQDGATQTSLGRTFVRSVAGPVFGEVTVGNRGGLANVISDNPYRPETAIQCFRACSFGRPSASLVAVEMNGVADDGRSGQALWLIDVPLND